MSSEYVQNTLSARFAIASNKEYICRSCHKSLLLEKKHHKRPHKNQSLGHNCILCCSASDNKSRPFQHMTYGRNDILADILHGKNVVGGAIICLRCHNKLIQNLFVSCCIWENVVKWKSTLIFKRSQYSTDGIWLQLGNHTPCSVQCICKVCHKCVCCKR